MSEESKKQSFMQRMGTAAILVPVLLVLLVLGGWAMAAVVMRCLCIGLHEVFHTLRQGGYRPCSAPGYLALITAPPLMMLGAEKLVLPVLLLWCMTALFCVMRREQPELNDVLFSLMPIFWLAVPAVCLFGVMAFEPHAVQMYLLFLTFAIPILGDTFAYFVGSTVGGPKLCPLISPNKTISGAIGGLVGSVLSAVLIGRIFALCVPAVHFPPFWAEMLFGLFGGVVAQLGDLLASMLKRHCKIKDYGHLFPGHGGMMDRVDSILFTAVCIYCFASLFLK